MLLFLNTCLYGIHFTFILMEFGNGRLLLMTRRMGLIKIPNHDLPGSFNLLTSHLGIIGKTFTERTAQVETKPNLGAWK
jgi:hypothetical protein